MQACQAALQLVDPDIAPVHRILSKWLDHTRDFAHATACNGAAHSILFAQISRSAAVALVCSLCDASTKRSVQRSTPAPKEPRMSSRIALVALAFAIVVSVDGALNAHKPAWPPAVQQG